MIYEEALEQYRQWRLMLKSHRTSVEAQMNDGYRAPLIEWQSGNVIDPRSAGNNGDVDSLG